MATSRRRNKSFLRVRTDPRRDDEIELSWWDSNAKLARDWLRSNPLKLGIDDESIGVIRQMLRRGDVVGTSDSVRLKCWQHILIEFSDVPGAPVAEAREIEGSAEFAELCTNAKVLQPRMMQASALPPQSPVVHKALPSPVAPAPAPKPSAKAAPAAMHVCNGENIAPKEEQDRIHPAPQPQGSATAAAKALGSATTAEAPRTLRRANSVPNSAATVVKKPDGVAGEASSSDDKLAAAAPAKPRKSLSAMSMMERQAYMLERKRQKEEEGRRLKAEAEMAECTHAPKVYSRRSSDSSVRSVVRQSITASKKKSSTQATASRDGASGLLAQCQSLMSGSASTATKAVTAAAVATAAPARKSSHRRRRTAASSKSASTSSSLLDSCNAMLGTRTSKAAADVGASAPALPEPESSETSPPKDPPPATTSSEVGQVDDAPAPAADSKVASSEVETGDRPSSTSASCSTDEAPVTTEADATSAVAATPFKFAPNSDQYRGKYSLQDGTLFELDSFYRKRDKGSQQPGVSLMMGRRENNGREQVVTILFDRSRFTEEQAGEWLEHNRSRFSVG